MFQIDWGKSTNNENSTAQNNALTNLIPPNTESVQLIQDSTTQQSKLNKEDIIKSSSLLTKLLVPKLAVADYRSGLFGGEAQKVIVLEEDDIEASNDDLDSSDQELGEILLALKS